MRLARGQQLHVASLDGELLALQVGRRARHIERDDGVVMPRHVGMRVRGSHMMRVVHDGDRAVFVVHTTPCNFDRLRSKLY